MRLLDLFCGKEKGMTLGFVAQGYNCTGIDIVDVKHYPGTFIQADLMEYEPTGNYDIVHASPPCTEFSIAKKCFYGTHNEMKGLDPIHRTFYLIHKLKPTYWILENVSGLEQFIGPPRLKIKYGKGRKTGCFWGNFPDISILDSECNYEYSKMRDPWKRAKIPLPIANAFAKSIR